MRLEGMGKKMKFNDCFELHRKLKKVLADDLVYSLVLDGDQYLLTVSAHKSKKYEFATGRSLQTCSFRKEEFNKPIDEVVNIIAAEYRRVLHAVDGNSKEA